MSQLLRSCLKKKKYRTLDFAEKVAERRGKEFGQALRAYGCNICSGYHLTSKSKWRKP